MVVVIRRTVESGFASRRRGRIAVRAGEGGQADDVVVGEVGDLDAAGGAAFGDQVAEPLVGGGMSVAVKPLPDQPSPRMMSLLPSEVQRNAAR